jgi:hypothetical protein
MWPVDMLGHMRKREGHFVGVALFLFGEARRFQINRPPSRPDGRSIARFAVWIRREHQGPQGHRQVATRRARADYKWCGFSCGRDDLAPRAHRRATAVTLLREQIACKQRRRRPKSAASTIVFGERCPRRRAAAAGPGQDQSATRPLFASTYGLQGFGGRCQSKFSSCPRCVSLGA